MKFIFLTTLFFFFFNACNFTGTKKPDEINKPNNKKPHLQPSPKTSTLTSCNVDAISTSIHLKINLTKNKCLNLNNKIQDFYTNLLDESQAYLNKKVQQRKSGQAVEGDLNFLPFIDKIEVRVRSLITEVSVESNFEISKNSILDIIYAIEISYYSKMELALHEYAVALSKITEQEAESLADLLEEQYHKISVDISSLNKEKEALIDEDYFDEDYNEQVTKKVNEKLAKQYNRDPLALIENESFLEFNKNDLDSPLPSEGEELTDGEDLTDKEGLSLSKIRELLKSLHSLSPLNEQGKMAKNLSLAGIEFLIDLLDNKLSQDLTDEAELVYEIILTQEAIVKGDLPRGLSKTIYEYCVGKDLWTGVEIEKEKRVRNLYQTLFFSNQGITNKDTYTVFEYLINILKTETLKTEDNNASENASEEVSESNIDEIEDTEMLNNKWFQTLKTSLNEICERKKAMLNENKKN